LPADPGLRSLNHPPFRFYLGARGFSELASTIARVAFVWHVYALTDSAFALGIVGLVQFLPTAILVFIAGHASDRYDRKRVAQVCQIVEALAALFLALGTFGGWLNAAGIFAAVALFGV